MDAASFADYLKNLLQGSGKPSYRRLGLQIGYGRTTVSDAFQGRRLPSWDVTEPLVRALGGDVAQARQLWAEAGGGGLPPVPEWLTDPVLAVPALIPGVGLAKSAGLAAGDPDAALADGWAVVRLSAAQLSYEAGAAPPDSGAAVVEAFRRAEAENRLPPGVGETVSRMELLHERHRDGGADVEAALQFVVFAYRLAGLVTGGRDGVVEQGSVDAPADIVTLRLLAEDFGWAADEELLDDFREFLAILVSSLRAVTDADRAVLATLVQRGKTLRLGLGSPTYGMTGPELCAAAGVPPFDLKGHLSALSGEGLVEWQRDEQASAEWAWTSKRDAYALDGLRSFCRGRDLDFSAMIRDIRLDWLG